MKKIFLLSLCAQAFAFCNTELAVERKSELTQDIIEQLSPVEMWYESATEGERAQLDDLFAQLFNCANEIAVYADETKLDDLSGAIRILTGIEDLEFTLSVQISIGQKSL
jgi:predicted ATPase